MPSRRSPGAEPAAAQGRIAGRGPVAVIDIGSNSVRLVVYERLARSPTPLFNEKMLAGLGAGVARTGRLADDAMEKATGALRRFMLLSRQMGVVDLDVVATAATREAENGPQFIRAVEAICGTKVQVLSGAEEARISALGIVAGFANPDGVAGDLGGGSLELTDVLGRTDRGGESLLLGGLRLQEASRGSLANARAMARDLLQESDVLRRLRGRTFYAIGGTWRSLARLYMRQSGYPLHVMHEFSFPLGDIEAFLDLLSRGRLDSVAGIGVVSKQRRTLLPYGAIVLAEVIRAGQPSAVSVSALGLREGILYDKLSPAEQAEDALLSAARELAVLRSRSPQHDEELIAWTAAAFSTLGVDETAEEARLREAACLLSDTGWRAHPDYRGEQSLNILANAAFVGIDHPGRVYLALAVYYRHADLADDGLGPGFRELAPSRYRERARTLAAAFRVAYLISGATPGVLGRTRLRRTNGTVELVLPSDLAALAGSRLSSRLKHFAAIVDLDPAIVVEG